jgi:hypothetical protein
MLGGYVVSESPLETSDETTRSIEIRLIIVLRIQINVAFDLFCDFLYILLQEVTLACRRLVIQAEVFVC